MPVFVDHLQLLPMPFRDGVRQPDGRHRPGGLGMATLSELLNGRGWTARVEDLGFDKPMPESRLAEAFARAIGDGVESAWERRRFPIVLARAGYAALGVIDALGARTGVVWASARGEYRSAGLLRRARLADRSLALLTGSAKRDKLAVRPARAAGRRVIVLGADGASGKERRAMAEDGIRVLAGAELDRLAAEVRSAAALNGAETIRAAVAGRGVVGAVAAPLFEVYLVPFEVTSVLLLAAIVGAVVLAKRRV